MSTKIFNFLKKLNKDLTFLERIPRIQFIDNDNRYQYRNVINNPYFLGGI